MKRIHAMLLGLLVFVMPMAAGCQQTLFSEADPYNRTRIDRYYEGDSAVAGRAQREQASQWGFALPGGIGNQ
jgi:hypothetical protein